MQKTLMEEQITGNPKFAAIAKSGNAAADRKASGSKWSLLSNHGHVLVCLATDDMMRMREIADCVGITERATQKIIADLEQSAVIVKHRVGRRNRYEILRHMPLRNNVDAHRTVGDLLNAILNHQAINEA